jgi:allantoicase
MSDPDLPFDLSRFVNLASPRLGTRVCAASDDFFADKSRLIQDATPVFIAGRYDENGKWMDGWETRRRRGLGHDWCLIELGVAGKIAFVDIDTRHFTGNYPPAASLEASNTETQPEAETDWFCLIEPRPLGPNTSHIVPINEPRPVRWLRLSIYPDGGVARLRVYGQPVDCGDMAPGEHGVELSALKRGGRIVAASDMH